MSKRRRNKELGGSKKPPHPNPLVAIRIQVGLSQQALAEALKVSRTLITKIETGKAPITPRVARLIHDQFGVEVPTGQFLKFHRKTWGPASECWNQDNLRFLCLDHSRLAEWGKKAEITVNLPNDIDDDAWDGALDVLRDIRRVLPGVTGFRASLEVLVEGDEPPDAPEKRLLLHFAKREGCGVRLPKPGERADLVVMPGNDEKKAILVEVKRRGAAMISQRPTGSS